MRAARLTAIDLAYGCHRGRFELPQRRVPLVIHGANGSGKTTFVEALVTAAYGLDVRADAKRLRERVPWFGDRFWARLELVLNNPSDEQQAFAIERDFHSQQALVLRLDDGSAVFRGDADPGSSTPEAQGFRRWLGQHLGLETRRAYEMTACVNQGALTNTRVGEHLLGIAAGGYTQVAAARAEIERRYYALTREPIGVDAVRRTEDGTLDRAEQEVLALEHRTSELRARIERRQFVLREHDQVRRELNQLRRDLSQLEAALPLLRERQQARTRRDRSAERAVWLEALHRDLSGAALRVESAEQAWESLKAGPVYPADFPERAAVLAELWVQKAAVDREVQEKQAFVDRRTPVASWLSMLLAGISVAALAGGVWLAAGQDQVIEGFVAMLVGVAGLAGLLMWRRSSDARWRQALSTLEEAARRQRDLAARIAARSAGLPEADTLSAETLADRRLRFETQQRLQAVRDETRRRLKDALTRTVEDLSVRRGAGEPDAPRDPPRVRPRTMLDAMLTGIGGPTVDSSSGIPAAATRLLAELQQDASAERLALSERDVLLRQTLERPIHVPADVTADAAQVEAALGGRRTRCDGVEVRLRALEARLASDERIDDSIVSLEAATQRARAAWEALAQAAEVNRRTFALLGEASEEFHRADEHRLLTAISDQLRAISEGALGPFVATRGLEDVRVKLGDRAVTLESPPLSYGEYHAVLLAARFGTADFLARVGVRPPVIIDEPFTHLDPRRAARLWELLVAAARERQVIVATQDRLVLEALGISPDIELDDRAARRRTEPAPPGPEPPSTLPAALDALRTELSRWEGRDS